MIIFFASTHHLHGKLLHFFLFGLFWSFFVFIMFMRSIIARYILSFICRGWERYSQTRSMCRRLQSLVARYKCLQLPAHLATLKIVLGATPALHTYHVWGRHSHAFLLSGFVPSLPGRAECK